jgi:flagellin
MALAIATNTGALMAAASATSVNRDMETSMERLSTGKRINSAKDDAAGVAIASRLTSEIRGTNQAIRNAQDGQALINTAEGAHKEVENILQRMRELATQAANDTNGTTDRTNLAAEMTQLTTEIDRIASTTSWAGQKLLDGATPYDGALVTTLATAHSDQAQFTFHVGSGTTANDSITANVGAVSATALQIAGTQPATGDYIDLSTVTDVNGSTPGTLDSSLTATFNSPAAGADLTLTLVATANDDATATQASYSGGTFSFVLQGTEINVTIGANGTTKDSTGVAQATTNAINAAGLTGITASSVAGVVTIDKTSALAIDTTANAKLAINAIDDAIQTVNSQRATLGAISNRLDNTVSNLTNVSINLEGGRGRIEDADFAAESTSLAKSQILQQASTAMLAQANASKQSVLSLLQG